MFAIRPAILADIPALARINVDTWRSNFAGIIPDDFLANMSYEKYQGFERGFISGKYFYYVAEIKNEITGYACVIKNSVKPEYTSSGELKMIYVKKDFQNMGIGKKLFKKATTYLHENGCTSMIALTLKASQAPLFYSAMGGVVCDERKEIVGGKELDEICYFYNLPLE